MATKKQSQKRGKKKTKKPEVDWVMVAQEYSLGQSSNRSLAAKYGVSEGAIRLRAKKEDWKKDLKQTFDKALKEAVINETAQELPRNRLPATQKNTHNAECVFSDENIVEAAVRTSIEVIKEHRVDIKNLQNLADKTGDVLLQILETGEVEKFDWIFGTGRDTVTGMLQKYVAIKEKIINLSRQAYNLDKEDGWRGGATININSPTEIAKLSDAELNNIVNNAKQRTGN